MKPHRAYLVTGIDTDIGKSMATGWLAALWRAQGVDVATQKLVQTGCPEGEISEDIQTHRRLMGIDLLPEDLDHTTCPLRFVYPASPHLAARMEGRTVDISLADRSTQWLTERHDTVLIEGAGGLLVPLTDTLSTADYAAQRGLPLILVTGARLGSLNHTLLTLEACQTRGLKVETIVYNLYGATSPEITADTLKVLEKKFDGEILELKTLSLRASAQGVE